MGLEASCVVSGNYRSFFTVFPSDSIQLSTIFHQFHQRVLDLFYYADNSSRRPRYAVQSYFAVQEIDHNAGFPYALAQILCSPPYLFTTIVSLYFAYISDKYKARWPIMVSQSLIGIIGLLIVLYAQAAGVRYFGLFIATFGTHANIATTLVYGLNQTAKVQKKGIVSAMAIAVGGFAGITGSFMFQIKDAPVSELSDNMRSLTNNGISDTHLECGRPLACRYYIRWVLFACRCILGD